MKNYTFDFLRRNLVKTLICLFVCFFTSGVHGEDYDFSFEYSCDEETGMTTINFTAESNGLCDLHYHIGVWITEDSDNLFIAPTLNAVPPDFGIAPSGTFVFPSPSFGTHVVIRFAYIVDDEAIIEWYPFVQECCTINAELVSIAGDECAGEPYKIGLINEFGSQVSNQDFNFHWDNTTSGVQSDNDFLIAEPNDVITLELTSEEYECEFVFEYETNCCDTDFFIEEVPGGKMHRLSESDKLEEILKPICIEELESLKKETELDPCELGNTTILITDVAGNLVTTQGCTVSVSSGFVQGSSVTVNVNTSITITVSCTDENKEVCESVLYYYYECCTDEVIDLSATISEDQTTVDLCWTDNVGHTDFTLTIYDGNNNVISSQQVAEEPGQICVTIPFQACIRYRASLSWGCDGLRLGASVNYSVSNIGCFNGEISEIELGDRNRNDDELEFSVMPNPVYQGDKFTLKMSNYSDNQLYVVHIYNMQGQLLMHEVQENDTVELFTQDLNAGVYMITLSSVNQNILKSKRIIIQ